MAVTVRYFAAARAVVGINTESLDGPAGGSLAEFVQVLCERHGDELARLLDRCSFFVDGESVTDRTVGLDPDSTLDVLPPYAGG
jgi:molybdopterin converting factor small subunit